MSQRDIILFLEDILTAIAKVGRYTKGMTFEEFSQEVKTMDGSQELEGIQFVMNTKGEQTAVLIDLSIHGEVWQDFYDLLLAQQRATEPRESFRVS